MLIKIDLTKYSFFSDPLLFISLIYSKLL